MELTREKVMAMEASWEMDKLIAERVMGWSEEILPVTPFDSHSAPYWCMNGEKVKPALNWEPSKSISVAWEVVNKIAKSVSGVELCVNRVTNAVNTGQITVHSDDSMPLAICKAALLTTIKE